MINNKKHFLTNSQINYLSYLISLVPASLIAGVFVADLIVSFCAIIFLYVSFKEKFSFFCNHWIIKVLIIFYFYLIVKSLINNEELHSILRSIFYIRYILFSLLICYIYNLNPKFSKIFFKFLTLTLVILSLHAYFLHFFTFDLFKMNFNEISIKQNFSTLTTIYNVPIDYRISGLFYSESILGSFVEKMLPIYLGLVFLNNKSKRYYFLSIIFSYLILISGERSAIALALLFFVAFFLMFNSNLKQKFYFFSVLSIGAIFVFSNPNMNYRIIHNTIANVTEKKIQTVDAIDKKLNINFFSLGHQGHFKSAYNIFIDNPIYGVGIKHFRHECKKPKYKDIYSCTTHPHNTYLQLLAETGIIGFSFIFIIFLFLSYQVFRIIFFRKIKTKVSNHYKCFLLGLFINLWPLIPTGSFFNNWISICYFLSIGFFLGEICKIRNQYEI